MSDRITIKCQACGEAENCDIFCILTLDDVVEDLDGLLCPVTGDEAEWCRVEPEKELTAYEIINRQAAEITAVTERAESAEKDWELAEEEIQRLKGK